MKELLIFPFTVGFVELFPFLLVSVFRAILLTKKRILG